MTLTELQKEVLQLPRSDRAALVQVILESLNKEEKRTQPGLKRGNLSRLRGIAKNSATIDNPDAQEDYVTYLTEKYK